MPYTCVDNHVYKCASRVQVGKTSVSIKGRLAHLAKVPCKDTECVSQMTAPSFSAAAWTDARHGASDSKRAHWHCFRFPVRLRVLTYCAWPVASGHTRNMTQPVRHLVLSYSIVGRAHDALGSATLAVGVYTCIISCPLARGFTSLRSCDQCQPHHIAPKLLSPNSTFEQGSADAAKVPLACSIPSHATITHCIP